MQPQHEVTGGDGGVVAPCCDTAIQNGHRFCSSCGKDVRTTWASVSGSAPDSSLDLVIVSEQGQERVIPLCGSTTIGKSDECDVCIPGDSYLSQRHARIELTGDRVLLEDTGSSNGSFVRATGPTLLRPGDQLILGSTVIHLRETTPEDGR